MSTIEQDKLEAVAQSFNQTFSVFSGGATAIGDGVLISNGVSQLNELDEYINSTGKAADVEDENKEALEEFVAKQQQEAEELAEKIEEAVNEADMANEIDIHGHQGEARRPRKQDRQS